MVGSVEVEKHLPYCAMAPVPSLHTRVRTAWEVPQSIDQCTRGPIKVNKTVLGGVSLEESDFNA